MRIISYDKYHFYVLTLSSFNKLSLSESFVIIVLELTTIVEFVETTDYLPCTIEPTVSAILGRSFFFKNTLNIIFYNFENGT